ncbi:NUDIX hydrolase [Candidatus Bathyarchaeota archaeon]|nr:MAG: NUDIX hydrolase [Candidatus Bathyarchaeota archaeon]
MQRKYPVCPLIGVGALIQRGDEFVVVQRKNEPAKGLWSIPGGLLELGERVYDGVKREVKEETGLDVEIKRLLDVIDNIVYDDDGKICYHYVLIDYLCSSSHGDLKAATDVKEAQWVKLKDLNHLPTTKTLKRLLLKANITEEGAQVQT